MYASAMNSKERENLLENERTMIASKLAELSEEQSKKMLQKEIRLREDAQSKFVLLEKVCKPMFSSIPHFGNERELEPKCIPQLIINCGMYLFIVSGIVTGNQLVSF